MTASRKRTVAAVAVAVPLAALSPGAVHPAHAASARVTGTQVTAAKAPDLDDFDLRRGSDRGPALRALGGRLQRSGVGSLLRSSGLGKFGRGCGGPAAVPSHSLVYCFNKQDSATNAWVPQGVTTVSDATEGERWAGGVRPMLVSWHDSGRIRLTFVDPDRHTYRHVLLVAPTVKDGRATYSDIGVHAGGIAWYGDKLYVADTRHGMREFDMRQIYDLGRSKAGSTGHDSWVGLHGDKYYGHGFRYVMPQTGSWHFVGGATGGTCRGSGPLRMSWIAVDRTTWHHVLIAGEYCRPKAPQGRVVTWPMGALSEGGTVHADWAAELPGDRIQGGVRTNGHWWFTQSRNKKRGRLLSTSRNLFDWNRVSLRTISHGPEDLSCFRGQHRIWTVAEYAHKRAMWSFPADSCA